MCNQYGVVSVLLGVGRTRFDPLSSRKYDGGAVLKISSLVALPTRLMVIGALSIRPMELNGTLSNE